jgi:spermidine/putrescine transport system permease protein
MIPMWINLLIRTYSMMALLDDGGLINVVLDYFFGSNPEVLETYFKIVGTKGAVIFGMVYDFLPYMILPIYTVMSKLDHRLLEAAQDLGCNNAAVMTRVVLPLTRSGIISGITMVFVPSISTFYISQKLGGPSTLLIGDVIEQSYNASNYHLTAALSFVLMIILLIGLAIMNKYTDDDSGGMMI